MKTISDLSTDELESELLRRRLVQEEIQHRIYTGELEATDADDIHDKFDGFFQP